MLYVKLEPHIYDRLHPKLQLSLFALCHFQRAKRLRTKEKEDERKKKGRNELVSQRKRKMNQGGGVVIAHLALASKRRASTDEIADNLRQPIKHQTGNAVDLRVYARRAIAVLAETLIKWIIKMILLILLPSPLADNQDSDDDIGPQPNP